MNRQRLLLFTGWISLGISLIGYALIMISAQLSKMDGFMRESVFFDSLWPYVNKPLFAACSAYCAVAVILLLGGLLTRDRAAPH